MEAARDVVAIYSRKSRFTGKGESIGNQVELCRAYIRSTFGGSYADSAVVYEDEGFSGGDLNRPDFRRMICAARKGQFRAVVVYRLDRISRNISDFSGLIQELGRLGIDFISIRERFDTSSPMGRAMMYIASVFSQLERETIAERIRDNLHELAKTGRWLGGNTPTGYTSESVKCVAVDGKSRKSCHLKLVPGEAELVRGIFDLYLQTDSLTRTEAELLRRRVKTRSGHAFSRFSIRAILQNPVYLAADQAAYRYFEERQAELCAGPEAFDGTRGILAYNRTDQRKGRSTVHLPVSQWIISVGRHPGLIPSGIWIDVQRSLERNQSRAYRKPRTNQALLTGLLWCGCGSRMYPKLTGRRTAEGEPAFVYICKQKERSKSSLCSVPNINGNQLDGMVVEQLRGLPEDRGTFRRALEHSSRTWAGGPAETCRQLAELRREQGENQRRMTALIDALADLGSGAAGVHVKSRLEELHQRDRDLSACIARLEGGRDCAELSQGEVQEKGRQLASYQSMWEGMTVEQKRRAVCRLVRRVVWDGASARLELADGRDRAEL